jgi:hypothetical protein
MLSSEQISFFDTFGYLVFRGLFSAQEMEVIDRAFEDVMAEDRVGQAYRGDKRHSVAACAEMRPALRAVIEDDRIYGAMEDLLGPDLIWLGSDGNYYTGDTAWHSDGTVMDMGRIKVALYLDPVSRDTGCLRFIPGSHKMPLHEELQALRVERTKQTIQEGRNDAEALDKYREKGIDVDAQAFDTAPDQLPAYAAESQPGDVVMFDENLYHASFGGKTGRRMFTMCYANVPASESAEAFLRRSYGRPMLAVNRATVPEGETAEAFVERSYGGGGKEMRALAYSDRDWVHPKAFLESESTRIKGLVARSKSLGMS